MADAEAAPQPKAGPSLIVQLGMLAMLTGAAIGLGWVLGAYLNGEKPAEPKPAAQAAEDHGAPAAGGGEHGEKPASNLLDLAPITVNLAAPAETWLRMEVTLVTTEALPQADAEAIHQDLMAYLRTLRLHQIEGASGFNHLRTDLQERAALRSNGRVAQVLIRTLLFE